jgi:hypothetical protein
VGGGLPAFHTLAGRKPAVLVWKDSTHADAQVRLKGRTVCSHATQCDDLEVGFEGDPVDADHSSEVVTLLFTFLSRAVGRCTGRCSTFTNSARVKR